MNAKRNTALNMIDTLLNTFVCFFESLYKRFNIICEAIPIRSPPQNTPAAI